MVPLSHLGQQEPDHVSHMPNDTWLYQLGKKWSGGSSQQEWGNPGHIGHRVNPALRRAQLSFDNNIYAWVGCNTAKFGHLYAAASTRPGNGVSVTSVLGGTSDNTGSSMARRLVLKTGLNIVLACNIPKDSPMLEAAAERKLIEKLRGLGYVRPKAGEANTSMAQY
uniref:Uncharacterized protein n=1 Tax=Oryza punctata TaxID=4537 RepID=A0A0E0MKE1_ORYPU